jgi:hypothetical protein
MFLLSFLAAPGSGLRASALPTDAGQLEAFSITLDEAELSALIEEGLDIGTVEPVAGGFEVEMILSPLEHAALIHRGYSPEVQRNAEGLTVAQQSVIDQEAGFAVYRSWDQEGGIRDELYQIAADHPGFVDLRVLGTTHQGREIIAMKVTNEAADVPDGSRPAVLYSSLQHAREWIAIETNRRLLHHFVDNYGTDPEITELIDENEYWFIICANPDGYQFTFEGQRLWRKNMRDNDGDGTVGNGDGVDPNRNFDAHWNYDINGSSSNPGSETYRGESVASEPETQAMQGLIESVKPRLQLNYHSAAELILYAVGWQDQTESVDHPIFVALAGTPDNPAVPGFLPELSSGLYITNGETCDYAYEAQGVLCYTPELSTPPPGSNTGSGFIFPDDETLVQAEFEINLPFAMDIARSVIDPANPSSHLGNTVESMYVKPFGLSYGSPQTVQVQAKRDLGEVQLRYQINEGPVRSKPTAEWEGGERYGVAGSVYYHLLRAEIEGAKPGDRVKVWFESTADGETVSSEPFSYSQVSDSGRPVLVLSAEDYTGIEPTYDKTDGPSYLQAYLDALSANDIEADVYDIDANGRVAPSALGVLDHYAAVVWYTGDDLIPRTADDQSQADRARLANETQLAVRDYLNEGGRLLWSGKYAGFPYTPNSGLGLQNDFLQYYLSAYSQNLVGPTPVDIPNPAGEGKGWWSGSANNLDVSVSREFDLSDAAAPVTFAFDSVWEMEPDADYGYVEASTNGSDWQSLPDMDGKLSDANPNNINRGWGLTGAGQGRLRFDLSAMAGMTLTLRISYDSDQGQNLGALYVDNLALDDANGSRYANDLGGDVSDWTVTGWQEVPIRSRPDVTVPPIAGSAPPFQDMSITIAPPGDGNQDNYTLFQTTSSVMPAAEYPHFESWAGAKFNQPGNVPHSGKGYLWSGESVYAWQQVTRTIDLSGETEGSLDFWVSRQMANPFDAFFVEARAVGTEDWTTLPDAMGHSGQDQALSCTSATWFGRFVRMPNYMSLDAEGNCQPSGTTGEWHAATGASDGWENWSIDLGAYVGAEVELSISYVSSRQAFPGVFLDDISISTGESTGFEEDLGGWTVTGLDRLDTGDAHATNFRLATEADYPNQATPIVITGDTILLGFGIEGIQSAEQRADLVKRAFDYLTRDIDLTPPQTYLYLPALRKD